MKLPQVSNEQLVNHYKRLGVLSEWQWAKDLVGRVWGDALMILIEWNLRAKKWKQPSLPLSHNGEIILNPRKALERANRSVTRMLEESSEVTKIKSISGGWFTWENGWPFGLPENIPAKIGDQVIYYGEWIGHPVRGLTIDGMEAFYKTKEEQDIEHREWVKKYKKEQKM